LTEVTEYTYDHAERLTKVEHTLGGVTVTLAENTYDELGRLQSTSPHGNTTLAQSYTYNIRDWLTGIGGKFTQSLQYNDGATPCYNGNISGMTWKADTETTTHGYQFSYDNLNRMLTAAYSDGSNADRFTEKVTGYDKNGNILALQRYGQTGASSYGLIDNLTFTLNGNQLNRVDDAAGTAAYNNGFEFKDAVKQENEYAYDANGNLTKDLNRNISDIQYNFLNLPSKVVFADGSTIEYVYAADGTKLRTKHVINGTTTTTDYCGNVVYENGVQKLLLTEEGYVTLADKQYHYFLKDHQGNNRMVVSQSGTVEEVNHYYPFGGVFANSTSVQPYKYNGKELDTKNGLNWYDYGARHYDPALGRFTTVDRYAEKYSSMSPYQYAANSPVMNIDVNGDSIIVQPNPNGIIDEIKSWLGFDTKYQSQVKADLKQLKRDDPVVGKMITELEKSENIHEITMPDERSRYQNATLYNSQKAEEETPQGSVVFYDPERKEVGSENVRTSRVGLVHELQHALDLDKGAFDPNTRINGILKMDIRAVNIENRIRKVTGDTKRIRYGKKEIPLEFLE
uniref:RHS repeat-associated core domain-containing protein n=1 Tax=Bacteroides togonis TaxID=1917883 RepID=UPI000AC5F679